MPAVTAFQTNFSAGEISPRLFARVDIAKYANGCYRLENFITQRFGGVKKRGGTEFIRATKSNGSVRLIPFVYSVTQAYILEFGDQYVRFFTNGGQVESGGFPVEVVTPWDASEVWDLQYAQSADVLYLAHPDYPPMTLSRTSATTFVLEEFLPDDGPFLPINSTATTLTPSGRASFTPLMTTNTAPSGTVSSSPADATAYTAFDGNEDTIPSNWNARSGYVQYDAGSGQVVDAYWLRAPNGLQWIDGTPTAWRIQGSNNGSNWTTLDTRKGETGWLTGEVRYYEFGNKVSYRYYRFAWNGSNRSADSYTWIAELGFNLAPVSQTAFDLTASATAGINDGAGFSASDVGRSIRLLGSDGAWRWARIDSYTSSTVVKVKLHGHSLPDTTPIINWQMGAWSDNTGWPACVGFFSGRLCFARTAYQPQTVWMSVVEDFPNFGVSDPLQDDDAIDATILADSINVVNWIAEGTDLFVGATAAIRTIGATTSTSAFSPTNIRQKRETNYGASSVQPVRVGTTALYSGYYRNDIREISYSFDVNGYVSQDLSILSEHIPAKGVKQLTYSQTPDSVVWLVMDDGSLAGMTYERDQEVIAFHRHPVGGTSVTVESVAAIPGSDRDEVWLSVKRTVNGGTVRYVERLSAGILDTQGMASATFLDSFLTYSGSSTSTISGLAHLEGQSVYVWDGAKQGPFTVTSGSITISNAVTNAIVGLTFTSALETLSPEAAAQGGTAQTREGRISEVFLRLNHSMHGKVGPTDGVLENLDYTLSTDNVGNYGSATVMFTGDVRVPIAMEWGRQKRIRVEHSDPSPFHCLGLITEIRVSG